MKLNRKTQPVVYRRVAIKTSILQAQAKRKALFGDLSTFCFALAIYLFLFEILT